MLPRHGGTVDMGTHTWGRSCDDIEKAALCSGCRGSPVLFFFFCFPLRACAGVFTVETCPTHCGRGLPCTYAIAWKSKSY